MFIGGGDEFRYSIVECCDCYFSTLHILLIELYLSFWSDDFMMSLNIFLMNQFVVGFNVGAFYHAASCPSDVEDY